jgi:hypothetical protein
VQITQILRKRKVFFIAHQIKRNELAHMAAETKYFKLHQKYFHERQDVINKNFI